MKNTLYYLNTRKSLGRPIQTLYESIEEGGHKKLLADLLDKDGFSKEFEEDFIIEPRAFFVYKNKQYDFITYALSCSDIKHILFTVDILIASFVMQVQSGDRVMFRQDLKVRPEYTQDSTNTTVAVVFRACIIPKSDLNRNS